MKLGNVARYFDKTQCFDAYSGAALFKCQLDLVDESVRDSVTQERRIMSVAPDTSMPSRKCISIHGKTFITGTLDNDSFNGSVIRTVVVLHEAPHLAAVKTLGEFCTGADGFSAYSSSVWIKDSANSASSVLNPKVSLFFASSEPVRSAHIVTMGGKTYIIRSVTVGASGTLIAMADEVLETSEFAQVITGVFDPVSEQTSETSVSTTAIRIRWESLHEYRSDLADRFSPGDMQVVIRQSVNVAPGTKVQLSDGLWRVVSALLIDGAWVCHVSKGS